MPAAAIYRIPRRRGMDPGTKRLAVIAGGLGAALIAVVGIWSIGERQGGGRLPVVEADNRPVRVKPENAGGLQIAGANDEILSGETGPQSGKLAPPPESPEPQALHAQPNAARIPSQPAPSASSPAALAPPSIPRASGSVSAEAPRAPAVQGPAHSAEAPKKEAISRPIAPGSRPAEVQLASVGSEDAAKAEWERLAKRMPEMLNGRRPAVSKTERDGRAYWRLRTGGFSDIAQATAFCERVRAKGGGCSLASF